MTSVKLMNYSSSTADWNYLLIQILFIIFVMFMIHEHDKYNEHI